MSEMLSGGIVLVKQIILIYKLVRLGYKLARLGQGHDDFGSV